MRKTIQNRKNKIREGSVIADVMIYAVAGALAFITLYPMYYVLVMSLSTPSRAATLQVYWWPDGWYFDGYLQVIKDRTLWRSYLNTIIYALGTTVGMLFTTSLAAYALSSKKLKYRKFLNIFLLIPMYISGGMIPTFLLINKIGMYNTPWAMIIPGAYSVYNVILMKAYFSSLPESLREAARIDGANNYQIMAKIYLPISKPIIAVIALYTIVGVWNSWIGAAIYLSDPKLQPLQIYLRRILVQGSVDLFENMTAEDLARAMERKLSADQLKYTVIMISSIPMLAAYPFFQKYFVKGIMLGSLKE